MRLHHPLAEALPLDHSPPPVHREEVEEKAPEAIIGDLEVNETELEMHTKRVPRDDGRKKNDDHEE